MDMINYFRSRKFFSLLILAMISLQTHAQGNLSQLNYAHPQYQLLSSHASADPSGYTVRMIKQAYGFYHTRLRGRGQTIALINAFDHPKIEKDMAVFNRVMHLVGCTTENGCFTKIYSDGTVPPYDSNWAMEIATDVEWAHAIAPQAKILLVETSENTLVALLHAVEVAVANGATIISMSWVGDEFPYEVHVDDYFKAPGVTYVAASGNSGHRSFYPAVSPYVVSVGGTTLQLDSAGNYISETAWSQSSGGLSEYEDEPAYQLNFNIPNNPTLKRGVPDVSYNADPTTGVGVYSSLHGGWHVIGGTGVATPQWAGVIAIGNSGRTSPVTNVNAALYQLAISRYSTNYHDIISGSNGSCGFLCTTQVGYDYVTGLGTPQATNIINGLARSP